MVFSGLTFLLLFFPTVMVLSLLSRRLKYQNYMLLAVSLLFYAWGEPKWVLAMLAVAAMNYLCALPLQKDTLSKGLRRLLLQQGLKPFRIQLHRQALQLQIFGILVVAFRHAGIDVPRDPRDGILEYGLLFRRLRVRAHGRPDLLGQAAYGEAKIHFALNRVSRVQLLFPILVRSSNPFPSAILHRYHM